MSSLVTSSDVYTYLLKYNIDSTKLDAVWIDDTIDNVVIPFVEDQVSLDLTTPTSEIEVTEFYSGTPRTKILLLHNRPIISVSQVIYVGIIPDFDVIGTIPFIIMDDKSSLRFFISLVAGERNISVTYKYGFVTIPKPMKRAILFLAIERVLSHLADQTGGGSLSINGFSKPYLAKGKYSQQRSELAMWASTLLRRYTSGVVGDI